MSEPPRDDGHAERRRGLQRRVFLGTLTIIAFMWALWDVWGVPASVFIEALVGIAVMIGAAVGVGALLGAALAWFRRRRVELPR